MHISGTEPSVIEKNNRDLFSLILIQNCKHLVMSLFGLAYALIVQIFQKSAIIVSPFHSEYPSVLTPLLISDSN